MGSGEGTAAGDVELMELIAKLQTLSCTQVEPHKGSALFFYFIPGATESPQQQLSPPEFPETGFNGTLSSRDGIWGFGSKI